MKYILTIVLTLLLPFASHADMREDQALQLREKAAQFYAEGRKPQAAEKLEGAYIAAMQVADPYTKVNALRYVAQAFMQENMEERGHEIFTEAMNDTAAVTPWYRKLSAIIGVVELQKSTGDGDGAKHNAMLAINRGLFEEIAASGQSGEIGRFLTSLDGLLNKSEIRALQARIEHTSPKGEFQEKALHKLAMLNSRP